MDESEFERISAFTLNKAFGFEPKISHELISNLGSPGAVFRLGDKELDDLFGPYSKLRGRIDRRLWGETAAELEDLRSSGFQTVAICDEDYPETLRDCPDAPAGLYIRSCTPARELFGRRAVSIVGTRDISPYGSEWTVRIVSALASSTAAPTICSGLAIGVDITAHMAALAEGLPTIAVLPCGITDVYPGRHRVCAGKIEKAPMSGLVTDFPPGTAPTQITFLRRNRIIAGLAESTILVESRVKGGGMLTARLASGYGRNVYAVPGRLDDPCSAGCNCLIAAKTAESVNDLQTFPEDLGLGSGKSVRKGGADELERICERRYGQGIHGRIAELVFRQRGISPEEIARRLELSVADCNSALMILEADGLVNTDLVGRCSINVKNI